MEVFMTKYEILQQLQDINTDAADYIYTENYPALNMLVNDIYKMGLTKEECFPEVLRTFRLVNIPFSIAGVNFLCEDLKDVIGEKYDLLIRDLVIHNMSLEEFLHEYGFDNEYDALNASTNDRKIYINTIKNRIKLIDDYTKKYHNLVKLYDIPNIADIHSTISDKDILQSRFTDTVAELVKAREKFYYYINYDLVGYDTEDLNKTLKQQKTNKDRFQILKNITDNVFSTLQKDSTVNFRDFFVIKDNKRVTFTTYIKAKGFTDDSWFDYKRATHKDFAVKREFYLQMAFFLGIPTSQEVEKFLNFNGHSIKCPFKFYPNTNIYDYDVCRYIDAGIDYNLINVMLGYSFI